MTRTHKGEDKQTRKDFKNINKKPYNQTMVFKIAQIVDRSSSRNYRM